VSGVKTKIVLVLPNDAMGGAERVMLNLVSELPRHEFDVWAVVLSSKGSSSGWLEIQENITYLNSQRVMHSILSLRSFLKEVRPAVVLSSHVHVNILLLFLACFCKRLKVVVREANMPIDSLKHGHWPKYYKLIYSLLLRRADKIIVTSKKMSAQFEKYFFVKPQSMFYLKNPVDGAAVRSAKASGKVFNGAGRKFVAVGRLVRQKRYDRMIEYMSGMSSADRLIIIGSGPEEAAIRQLIKDRDLEEQITLFGQSDCPWGIMKCADALLISSQWEGMPNVVLEAMCLGLPVIASGQCGGLEELESEPGCYALRICKTKNQFVNAMKSVQVTKSQRERVSQLPEEHEIKTVSARFKHMLNNTVIGA
jgi:glycosyltransferase involved in cell wall biosynthesis